MKNSILILVFNFSDCIKNKEYFKKLYSPFFKKIIFYSDFPKTEDKEVNFLNINRGYIVELVFYHFYLKYKQEIEDCDGIFYTMDDNIINVNILNRYDNNKIIFFPSSNKSLNLWGSSTFETWFNLKNIRNLVNDENNNMWLLGTHMVNKEQQINNVKKLINHPKFKQYQINDFSGGFSDFFYLPKKYLTSKIFKLFKLFSEYNIFLEIAIPTIIHNLEKDIEQYQYFSSKVLWHQDRNKIFDLNFLHNSFKNENNLIVHPIKINQTPELKKTLDEIFGIKKCIIITTINKPTETILKHIKNTNYDLIIVGDKKTPNDYKNLNCIFLDIETQKKLFPDLCDLIPYNHYCRKNIGYLYAIKKEYKIIYETDDDNVPYDNFDNILNFDNNLKIITENNSKWINIFKYFTNNSYIWPRGLPLSKIKNEPNFTISNTNKKPSIINGLVENDPDVDSCFRIICNHQNSIKWEKNKSILIDNKNLCVFNTQNTFWLNPDLFISMLIPCSVSFRYCDILRGIITNIILKHTNNSMLYTSPNVIQNRNEHNLIEDFKSEYEMYINNEKILDFIENKIEPQLKYLYLIQTEGKIPDIYKYIKKNSKYVLLSYKYNTEQTDIFFPNSTWTTGRNKLREYVLKLEEKYDYYIFIDEDIIFNPSENFGSFEKLLNLYRPYIGNPNLGNYYEFYGIPQDNHNHFTIYFDGICNAFSSEAINDNLIFPYIDKFDNRNWWMSQFIMIILCSIYKKEVVVFTNLKIHNTQNSSYPKEKGSIWQETEKYVFNNLIKIEQLSIIETIKTKSIWKIIDFLNVIFSTFDKINLIDVGCAVGDIRKLLTHNNIFSIGIDPLIEEYKQRNINQCCYDKYNVIYDRVVDTKDDEIKTFNVTQSLDTSSLYEFGNITNDINNEKDFFIPKESNFITNIISKKKVKTLSLKTIIENNIGNQFIHILKIDCKGNDLNVVKSADKYLINVLFIIIESNRDDRNTLYKNSSKFSDDYKYLKLKGFELVCKEVLLKDDYDCLYYNTKIIKNINLYWNKLEKKIKSVSSIYQKELLVSIYKNLLDNNVIKQLDIQILNKWLEYFK